MTTEPLEKKIERLKRCVGFINCNAALTEEKIISFKGPYFFEAAVNALSHITELKRKDIMLYIFLLGFNELDRQRRESGKRPIREILRIYYKTLSLNDVDMPVRNKKNQENKEIEELAIRMFSEIRR